jgi:hypothetical protein
MAVGGDKGNGCGPAWMPNWVKWLLFNWFFEAQCNKHDHGYEKGGGEVKRFECDWKLGLAMRQDIKRLNWYLKPVAIVVGVTFYLIVRLTGWFQYNYHGYGVPSQIMIQYLKKIISKQKK